MSNETTDIALVAMSKTPLLEAVTLKYVDKASSIMRVNFGDNERPDDVATVIMESIIQAHLLCAAGSFNQFAREMPVVICSIERLPNCQHLGKPLITSLPLRTNTYPRRYLAHDWIEPSHFDEKGDPVANPDWGTAKYEMAIFADPTGIVYNYLPLTISKKGPQNVISVSGDFEVDKDAVFAVPFKR